MQVQQFIFSSVGVDPCYVIPDWRWLGLKAVLKTIPEDLKEFWTAQNAGNFLLTNSQIENSFSINLRNLIQRTTNGNINDFAYLTGVLHLAIRRLIKGTVSPTLAMLIAICHPLKISIVNLFGGNIEIDFNKNDNCFTTNKILTKEEVKPKLIEYFDEIPPLSANEVARRTGWQTTRFQRNFPDEYKKIVERYLQHQADKLPNYTDKQIEGILINAVNESPSPSLQSVFRRIGCRSTGYRYYSRFPELCDQISNRYKQANKKEFDLEAADQTLKLALKEELTPSFSEVARRLKCSRTTLNIKFPELSAELHRKYKSALKTIRDKNKQEMHKEIAETIHKLQNQQKSATESAVRKLLKRKWNDKKFKQAYKIICLKEYN